MSTQAKRWTENRPPRRGWPRLDLRETWLYREVGLILAQRDVKVRYSQTFFGVAWAVLQPLLAMLVFVLVLGRISELTSVGVPYAAFVVCGLAVWFSFASAVSGASESLVGAPELVTKVYFPRVLAPLGAVLATAVDLAVALVLAQAVALIAGVPLRPSAVLVAPAVLLALVASLSVGLWFAALIVLYRDVRHAIPFFMQLLFFVSPVLYRPEAIDDRFAWVFALNPLTAPVELTRWSLLGTELVGRDVLVSSATTAVLLVGGLLFFRRTERHFADRI